MIRFLNQRFRVFLLFALAILGVSFIFFGDWSNTGTQSNPVVLRVLGQPVTIKEFRAAAQDSSMLFFLRTGQSPDDFPQAQGFIETSTWQRLLVNEWMHRAGMEITDSHYRDYIQNHPAFQKEGEFDPAAFSLFYTNFLNPQGIRDERFESAVRKMLLQDKAVELISSTAVVLPAEVRLATRMQYGQVQLLAVEIRRDAISQSLAPGDEDLEAFYNQNLQRFMVPEARKFEVISFLLTPEEQEMEEEERKEAMARLGEEAYAFTQPFYDAITAGQEPPDWTTAVQEAGLSPTQTDWLEPNSDAYLPSIMREMFKLTMDAPVSGDYLRTDNGYLVFRLIDTRPPEPQPFAEVREEVQTAWINQNTSQQMQQAALELNNTLLNALSSGAAFREAATGAGYQVTSIGPFVPAGEDLPPDGPLANIARNLGSQLQEGELSRPTPTPDGVALFYLASRDVPTAEKIAEVENQIRSQLEAQYQRTVTESWLLNLIEHSDTELPESFTSRGI